MSEETKEPEINTVVSDAIAELLKGLPSPLTTGVTLTHGIFNRHMFLEAVVVKGGKGVSIDQEDIQRHGALTDKEFVAIKDEYIAKGIITEEKNMFDVVMYKLRLTPLSEPT